MEKEPHGSFFRFWFKALRAEQARSSVQSDNPDSVLQNRALRLPRIGLVLGGK